MSLFTQLTPLPVHAVQPATGVTVQPVCGLQPSVVQALPSLQVNCAPRLHVPPPQVSLPLQALPSEQPLLLFVCEQPLPGLQASLVQPLLSLQLTGVPARPLLQGVNVRPLQ